MKITKHELRRYKRALHIVNSLSKIRTYQAAGILKLSGVMARDQLKTFLLIKKSRALIKSITK